MCQHVGPLQLGVHMGRCKPPWWCSGEMPLEALTISPIPGFQIAFSCIIWWPNLFLFFRTLFAFVRLAWWICLPTTTYLMATQKSKSCEHITNFFLNLMRMRFLADPKCKRWKIYFGPLVLAALKCYCGDNGHKMQTNLKALVSKNAATWRLRQTFG